MLLPQGGSPGSGDPPEPEELIKALQELENSASSDATVGHLPLCTLTLFQTLH